VHKFITLPVSRSKVVPEKKGAPELVKTFLEE
jgi:hypothetical protein